MENRKLFIISALIGISSVFLFVIFITMYARSTQDEKNISAQIDFLQDENQDLKTKLLVTEYRESKNTKSVCVETDSGQDYFTRGVIKFNMFDAGGKIVTTSDAGDACVDAIVGGESKKGVLREYYCDETNNVQSVNYVCPKGCLSGACKR